MLKGLRRARAALANFIAARWARQFTWTWNHEEAAGEVRVTRGYYGAYLGFPEIQGEHEDVCMADLYYRSDEGATVKAGRPFVVSIYEPPDFSDPAEQFEYHKE